MSEDIPTICRAERRARTRTAILAAARETFAANGFQKATIRAVAERAGCDPALVMQHFGNKNELFRAATAVDLDLAEAGNAPPETRNERLLECFFAAMDAQSAAVASTLRTMLTHDGVASEALALFNPPGFLTATDEDSDPLAALRAELAIALNLGAAITRYVLPSPAVQNATVEELLACLLPAVEALRTPSAELSGAER